MPRVALAVSLLRVRRTGQKFQRARCCGSNFSAARHHSPSRRSPQSPLSTRQVDPRKKFVSNFIFLLIFVAVCWSFNFGKRGRGRAMRAESLAPITGAGFRAAAADRHFGKLSKFCSQTLLCWPGRPDGRGHRSPATGMKLDPEAPPARCQRCTHQPALLQVLKEPRIGL